MALRIAGQNSRQWLQLALQHGKQGGPNRWCSTNAGRGRVKTPEQMTEEELKVSLPSMLFTTGNLIWSTTLAVGVAAGGLLAMFWVGTFITGAARSLKHLEDPPQPPPPPAPKSLAELIVERKAELETQLAELQQLPRTAETKQALNAAELETQLAELQQLPRTAETKQALNAVRKELRQYRDPSAPWWSW